MKHRPLDLASEITRASLPRGLEGFLFPTFEAVSNALHSIDDRFGDKSYEKGQIKIEFNSDTQRIIVSDNGDGFNVRNTDAFLTPFTGNKLRRNGKGFGRYISFKIFNNVFYASPLETEDGAFTSSIYEYKPLDRDDNLIPISGQNFIDHHSFDRGLTVSFQKPKDDFKQYFDFTSDEKIADYSEESVLIAILDHFLLDFVQKKIPKNFVCQIGGATLNLNEFFSDSVTFKCTSQVKIDIDGHERQFDFQYMQIDAEKSKRHNLYFYADNRATSDLENISKGLKDNHFEDQIGRKYNYLVAVSSDFFKSSQSRDRIENLATKIKIDKNEKPLKDALSAIAKTKILDLEPEYTGRRRSVIRKNIEELIALDPMLRRGLGSQTVDEFVDDRGITETREQLARDLFVVRMRNKFDFRKVNSETTFETLSKIVREKIPEDAKDALAVYVAYRNDVIKVMKEMLNRREGKLSKEDAMHELIYPRYKDSEEVDFSSHNLWLIDDDLAYAQYISSDRTPKGRQRDKGMYAHDLLINNQDELLIVEMKRPQKKSFDGDEDPKKLTDHPVQQLKKQIGQIRDFGKITTSGDREIIIPGEKMVRAYVLIDWNDELETYLKDENFIITNHGGPMAYKYFDVRNIMIEVLAFDRLADRASKRNEVFTNILNGQSTYEGKTTDRLAAE